MENSQELSMGHRLGKLLQTDQLGMQESGELQLAAA